MVDTVSLMKKLYNFDAWRKAWKHEKPVKNCFLILKREAPGICPVFPMVNPALGVGG